MVNPKTAGAKSPSKVFRRRALTISIASIFVVAAQLAAADTLTFKDLRKPNGHVRADSQEKVDALGCGATKNLTVFNVPTLERCMLSRGWAVDKSIPDEDVRKNLAVDNDTYVDGTRKGRGNRALHGDVAACSQIYGAPKTGVATSDQFKQCMSGHGWRFARTDRAPNPPIASGAFETSAPANDTIQQSVDQENAANAAASAAASDAAAAAAAVTQQPGSVARARKSSRRNSSTIRDRSGGDVPAL